MFIFGRTNGTLELHTFITSFTEKLHILSVRSTLGNSTAPQPLVVQLLLPSPSLPLLNYHPMCVRVPRPLGTTAFASITTITWRPLSPVRFKKERKGIFSSPENVGNRIGEIIGGKEREFCFSFQNRFVRYGFTRMNLIIN